MGAVAGLGMIMLGTGCVSRRVYVQGPPIAATAEVTVTEAPPPLQREVRVVSPGPGYAWVPGYWSWHGRWVWVSGRYVVRPHSRARWHEGHWQRHGRTYVWVGGHW
jgi:hypothetical protein